MSLSAEYRWRRFRNWQFGFGATSLVILTLLFFFLPSGNAASVLGLVAAGLFFVFFGFQVVRTIKFFTDQEFWQASRTSSAKERVIGRVATVALVLALSFFVVMLLLGRLK